MKRYVELRKLPAASLSYLIHILEINNDWQKVACLIPKDLNELNGERSKLRYNTEDIRLIEEHAKSTKRRCAEVLFDEWGTAGQVRPNVDILMKILLQAQMFRAVDEITRMLGEHPSLRPDNTPAAYIAMSETDLLNDEIMEQGLSSTAVMISENSEKCLPDFKVLLRKT